jgi:uncharacterized OB-fold protein
VIDTPPPFDEPTAPWWDATRERRLLLQRCTRCAAIQHPPRRLCTTCGVVDAHTWIQASGAGVLDSYTVVHRAPRPDLPVPYTVARVRLVEGPILLTTLIGVPDDASAFDAVLELDWHPLPDGRNLPVFGVRAVPLAPGPGM